MAYAVSAAFVSAIEQGSSPVITKLDILDWNVASSAFVVRRTYLVDVFEGAVQVNRMIDVRRSFSFSIDNELGIYTPGGPGADFFMGTNVRLWRGIRLPTGDEWVPLVTGTIDAPTIDVGPDGTVLRIAGRDLWGLKLGQKSLLTAVKTFAAGTTYVSVISQLATDGGIPAALYAPDPSLTQTLASRVTYEIGTERGRTIAQLARDMGARVYFDPLGTLVVKPAPNLTLSNLSPVYTFQAGANAIMLGLKKQLVAPDVYNDILVIGASSANKTITSQARDTNAVSPTYYLGSFGDQVMVYRSPMITTQAQADAVAAQLLRDNALYMEQIDLPTVTLPYLEADDVIRVVETDSKTADNYGLVSFNIPLALGAQALATQKARALS